MFSEDVQQVPKGAPPPTGPLTVLLNSEESMFAYMRDLNFSAVGQQLSREARKITAAYDVREGEWGGVRRGGAGREERRGEEEGESFTTCVPSITGNSQILALTVVM